MLFGLARVLISRAGKIDKISGRESSSPSELTEGILAENNNWTRRNRIAELPRGEVYIQNLDLIAPEVAQKRASKSQMLQSF